MVVIQIIPVKSTYVVLEWEMLERLFFLRKTKKDLRDTLYRCVCTLWPCAQKVCEEIRRKQVNAKHRTPTPCAPFWQFTLREVSDSALKEKNNIHDSDQPGNIKITVHCSPSTNARVHSHLIARLNHPLNLIYVTETAARLVTSTGPTGYNLAPS